MKRLAVDIVFISIPFLLLISCDKSIPVIRKENQSYRVTIEDVNSYLCDCRGLSADTKSIAEIEVEPVLHDNDTVMYIINYGEGWDVLSADKRAPVVLMTCDKGSLDINGLYSNPVQTEYVDKIANVIADLSNSTDDAVLYKNDNWINSGGLYVTSRSDTWTDWFLAGTSLYKIDTLSNQSHLLLTHWGQQGKWNKKAPYSSPEQTSHCPTGCVMVAGSQVLYYLHYKIGVPDNIYMDSSCSACLSERDTVITLNDTNVLFQNYDNLSWDLMPLSQDENLSQTRFNYVSTLMTRIGYLVSATYTENATGAYTYNLLDAFEDEFSIRGVRCDYADFDIVREQIVDKGLPCIFSLNSSVGGHAVVADGFRYLRVHTKYHYIKYNEEGDILRRTDIVLSYRGYVAINWGWDGLGDNDQETGATIWYNTATIDWMGFDTFKYMLYGFECTDN